MKLPEEQIEQRKKVKLDYMQNYINKHLILRNNKTFRTFLWHREIKAAKGKDTVVVAIKDYLSNLSTNMNLPNLHIWGKSGSGKSHLAQGLVRYIVLNKWELKDVDLKPYAPVEFVRWPTYIQAILNKFPDNIDWLAPLMVIEDLDERHPIPKSGSSYWLERFVDKVKPRVEQYHLPTIFVTRRSVEELTTFLATKENGKTGNSQAVKMAKEAAYLIGGNACAIGRTYADDMRASISKSPKFATEIAKLASMQQVPFEGVF